MPLLSQTRFNGSAQTLLSIRTEQNNDIAQATNWRNQVISYKPDFKSLI